MGGHTIWKIPMMLDLDAHIYPRRWKRNSIVLCFIPTMLIFYQFYRLYQPFIQPTMNAGEYMDWGSHHAPKRIKFN